MQTLNARIQEQFSSLSKGQQDVARFVLSESKLIALYPAKKVGELTGTSETTVIRFCYSLGYSGYSEMQNDIRKELLFSKPDADPMKQYHTTTKDIIEDADHIRMVIQQDVMDLQMALERIDLTVFDRAADAVVGAEKVFVAGVRFSFSPAYWLWYSLNFLLGNVNLFRGQLDDTVQLISKINQDSVVLVVSLPRYNEETLAFAKVAKSKGATVIAFTDSEISPAGLLADVCVLAPQPSVFKGMAAVFSLMNAFVTHVAAKDWPQVQQKLLIYDENWDLWLEHREMSRAGASKGATGRQRQNQDEDVDAPDGAFYE
ncbi:MurR/RpiR family transcriptional regulator [Alicyclobacillus ferrooxydans]|uniref:MurR/RpiR family transcriptional regulator n=1 Tax=Alicyclobacillus ferrooxydans TaxID=471514 RepID=UPI0006D5374B|nr:MurR/RpiR family transcriptional regulator [Alicyclobacillus ferrooxydans]